MSGGANLLALAAMSVLLASCVTDARLYPDCAPSATGGEICAVPDREEVEAAATVQAWLDVYSVEWSRAQLATVLDRTRIIMGPIADMPHPCAPDAAGCFAHWLDPVEAWVDTRDADGALAEPCRGALAHELIHAAEYVLEQSIDYEHDDVPRRWNKLLQRAKTLCAERLEQ